MNVKISTGKVKSAYRGGRIPLQGTRLIPIRDIVHPRGKDYPLTARGFRDGWLMVEE